MTRAQSDIVFIPSLSGKRGTAVYREDYVRVKTCILQNLIEGDEMTLTELLEATRSGLANDIAGDIGWLFLIVKAHLEKEGLLKQGRAFPGQRVPSLRISGIRKARKEYFRLMSLTNGD